jgi:hypothetical protein
MNDQLIGGLLVLLCMALATTDIFRQMLRASRRKIGLLEDKLQVMEDANYRLVEARIIESGRKDAYATGVVWLLCMGYGRLRPQLTELAHQFLNEMLNHVKGRPFGGPGLNTQSYVKERTPP